MERIAAKAPPQGVTQEDTPSLFSKPRVLACLGPDKVMGPKASDDVALLYRICLQDQLISSPALHLVEREALEDLMAEMSLGTSDIADRSARPMIGKLLPAGLLLIGDVWKAKSPMELLYLFGDRITSDELNRFFEIAREVLSSPDPVLELPEQDRFAAQVYDKVRPQSGLLIEALCDTLIKLAVRGTQVVALLEANIEGRITGLVREVLDDGDATRWLSLSSLLPSLAEAAPFSMPRASASSGCTSTKFSGQRRTMSGRRRSSKPDCQRSLIRPDVAHNSSPLGFCHSQ